jgi:AsmA protein
MIRKQHIWAGIAATVILVLVFGSWLILSPGWAVGLLQDQVSRKLGRELKVAGSVHVEFSPALALRLDRVSLTGASAEDDDFITASSLRVPIHLSGLFAHNADLSKITLRDAQIGLVIDELGRASWPETAPSQPASIQLLLENASVRFFDQRSTQAFSFSAANLAIGISDSGELTLEGAATINRQHAKLQAYVKNLTRLSGTGSPAELSLEAPALSVDFNGRLATAEGLGLAGTVTLSGPDLRQALRWAGGAAGGTLGLKAFTLTGGLDATARAFGVHQAEMTVDGISGKGDVTLDFRGETPKLQAVVTTDAIDLDKYIPASGVASDWGTAPLNFSALRGIDGAVTIDAKNLAYSGAALGPSKIAANLVAGRLDTRIVSASSETSILLDGSTPLDSFALVLSSKGSAAQLLGAIAGISWLDGQTQFNATLAGSGNTQQEMISTLKGEAQVKVTDGRLRGFGVAQGLAAVAREMQNGWPGVGKGETPFNSLAASFTVGDGIANMKTFKLESPDLSMSGAGEIDLLRRAVDLRVDPRLVTATSGETAGLPVAIVVKGPWGSPRIYPDMANIVANPKAAYEALKSIGLPIR